MTDRIDHKVGLIIDDEGNVQTIDSLGRLEDFPAIPGSSVRTLVVVFSGGGAPLNTNMEVDISLDFDCTITEWRLVADAEGSVVIDIWKVPYSDYPPNSSNSITGSSPPTLNTENKAESSIGGDWDSSISAGDILRFSITSVSDIDNLTLTLKLV